MDDAGPPIDLAQEAVFRIGGLEVRPSLLEVRWASGIQRIQRRPMQVLVALGHANGSVVSRDDLLARCWDGREVGDDAINRVVGMLRQLFRDAGGEITIDTIPRVGHRILAPEVVEAGPSQGPAWRRALGARSPAGLSWAAVAGGLVLVMAIAGGWMALGPGGMRADDVAARQSFGAIAVLPFSDFSPDGDLTYLAEGVAEEFRNGLAEADRNLRVSARASAHALQGTNLSPAEMAEGLHVDALLDGSIVAIDDQMRLALSLIDPDSGHAMWQRTFDFSVEDIDTIRPIVVSDVLQAINRGSQPEPQYVAAPAITGIAYDTYLKGNYFLSRGDSRSLARARELFMETVEVAPDYAPAYAQLVVSTLASPHPNDHPYAREYLERAKELAPYARETLLAEQIYNDHMRADGLPDEWLSRPNEPRRAEALDYGARLRSLVTQAKYREAEALVDEILQHDPIGLETNIFLARVLNRRGQVDRAVARINQALIYHPESLELKFWLVNAYAEAGNFEASVLQLVDLFEVAPDDFATRYFLSVLLGETGFVDEALAVAPDPLARLRAAESAPGRMPEKGALTDEEKLVMGVGEVARAAILSHDLVAARPSLETMYRREAHSNFYEHPSDYKPYLAMARLQAGDAAGADELNQEVLKEIREEMLQGDESVVLFVPFKVLAAAARDDRDELFALLDVAADGGYALFGLDDVMFDHLRDEPEFARRYEAYLQIRREQAQLVKASGAIDRVQAVLKAGE